MNKPDLARVKQVVFAALARLAAEREAFVAGACGDDAPLLAEVRSPLAALDADNAGGLLPTAEGVGGSDMRKR